MRKYTRATALC